MKSISLGDPYRAVAGVDVYSTSITWSSVSEMEDFAEHHGVSKEVWPIYRDCQVESEVPLKDAEERSADLRQALDRIDAGVREESYWLSFVWKLLQEGNSFFIMV